MSPLEEYALWIRCEYCSAPPDRWCVTKSGRQATFLHAPRINPVQMAFGSGYGEAEDYRLLDLQKRADALEAGLVDAGVNQALVSSVVARTMRRRWFA